MNISPSKLNDLVGFTREIRLLYVEDNDIARESTLEVFEDFFEDITIAKDGLEGLEKFKDSKFDLVITDINMPKMDGIKMTSHIRELNLDIPILILSAYNESGYFMETIKLGVEGYLLKPIDIEQFIDVLLRVAKNIQYLKENIEYKNNLEKKVIEKTEELHQAYTHDSITGIENTYRLNEYIKSSEYSHILLLDISNFSIITKEYGRDFASQALKEISEELKNNIGPNNILLKAESDRFIILSSSKNDAEINDYTFQLQSYFDQKNVEIDDYEININFTIGIALIEAHNNPLINVEYALESCKSIGTRFHSFYHDNEIDISREKEMIKWLKITKEMISKDDIFPYFQPMQDLNTGEVIKYEALARGKYQDEIIPPFKFLGAAERLGLITSITKMMINKSFSFFENKNIHFSLNITERDLIEGYLIEFLEKKSKKYNIKPECVTLEILENITTQTDSISIIGCLNDLRELGYHIAIDDFGVENSNFSRLLDISIDIIKIDGIFIKNLVSNDKDIKIVRGIVALAKSLNISVIAEFVETSAIYEILKDCGVDIAQGYFIGKPDSKLLQRDDK